MTTLVSVHGLEMTYRAPVRPEGLRAAFRALVHREYRHIAAVADMSFEIAAGEVVGFLGPNGAGKTTTLKILSGILHPTSGDVRVLGFLPSRRRHEFLTQIALVRGSQPIGLPTELTVLDSFRYQQLLYGVRAADYQASIAELTEMLELQPLLDRQVRALSLGERMRAGLALALLYRPRVLFLDEPTLGLDVTAAIALRRFVAAYAASTGATVLLTSHYMADVQSLCRRVVLIDHGRLRYDGGLDALAADLAPYKLLRIALADPVPVSWADFGTVEESDGGAVTLRVRRDDAAVVTGRLLAQLPVVDLSVTDPPLETVLDRFYRAEAT